MGDVRGGGCSYRGAGGVILCGAVCELHGLPWRALSSATGASTAHSIFSGHLRRRRAGRFFCGGVGADALHRLLGISYLIVGGGFLVSTGADFPAGTLGARQMARARSAGGMLGSGVPGDVQVYFIRLGGTDGHHLCPFTGRLADCVDRSQALVARPADDGMVGNKIGMCRYDPCAGGPVVGHWNVKHIEYRFILRGAMEGIDTRLVAGIGVTALEFVCLAKCSALGRD